MKFYLGTHRPEWLWQTTVPLFVSRRTLRKRISLYPATCDWALDSGGFSELSLYGRWTVTPMEYALEVRHWQKRIGRLDWAACMDWMCEPWILAKTGLTVQEHQQRTIASVLELRALAPSVPFIPVLQGWEPSDYLSHIEQYREAGIDLTAEPVVGIGSVCRRQHTEEVEELIKTIKDMGIRLHGFGFKILGLRRVRDHLASADSLSWSLAARHQAPLAGCSHQNCANCLDYALQWRERVA